MQALEDAGRMILRSYRFGEFSCAAIAVSVSPLSRRFMASRLW